MHRIVLLALTLTASVAHAEDAAEEVQGIYQTGEPNAYAAAGGIVGEDHFQFHGIVGEAGFRLGHTPLFGRVMADAGNTALANDPGRGTYVEGRAGLEARQCRYGGIVCGSLGLDLGYHRARYTHVDLQSPGVAKPRQESSLEESFDTTIAVPRLTVDAGGRVRVRGVVELPLHVRDSDTTTGVAFTLGLGVGF